MGHPGAARRGDRGADPGRPAQGAAGRVKTACYEVVVVSLDVFRSGIIFFKCFDLESL